MSKAHKECKQPYTFVPVVTGEIKTQDVTFHNGEGSKDKLTGSLLCTLTAKTPLFVGHFQYQANQLSGLLKRNINKEIFSVMNGKYKKTYEVIKNAQDHIVLPQGWEGCGYPQQDSKQHNQTNYIVHKEKHILEPLFLNGTPDSPVLISSTTLKGMLRQSIGAITNSPMERVAEKQFSYRPGVVYSTQRNQSQYKLFKAKALTELQQNSDFFKIKLVDDGDKYKLNGLNDNTYEYNLDKTLIERYWLSIDTYEKKTTKNHINKDDSLYVEFDKTKQQIVSFGNHEQYRWIYADTTTKILDGTTGKHKPRLETHSHIDEKIDKDNAKLTATRALFGYVDGGNEAKDDNLTLGIGEKDYSRLAGRISINTAVEVLKDCDSLSDRFVEQKNSNHNIPLRILSGPKASAYECYLDQSKPPAQGNFNTYGDFPGFEASGTPLAGRKFYYRWKPTRADYTLKHDDKKNEYKDSIALAGKQSAIARYISKEGRQFKFTLRFKDLSEAELGAIIAALSPKQMAQDESNQQAEYWQQLGHGRPLGLGSVSIEIDKLVTFDDQLAETEHAKDKLNEYIKTFKDSKLCNQQTLQNWLDICQPKERPHSYLTVKQHGDNHLAHIRDIRKANAPKPNVTSCYKP